VRAGLLPENTDERTRAWFSKVVALLEPSVDKLDQLPERAALIFRYDAAAAVNSADNAEVLASPKTSDVLAVFAQQVEGGPSPMTPEAFKGIMNEVKAKTGVKGKDLFHPVRIALTGSHSGPEFDKLIPILEEGSRLELPQHVMNVRERLAAFRAARGK
jgi:glutamyl-tRNA synthetase/nondiscriminating glutamyl-tRNA synthetase